MNSSRPAAPEGKKEACKTYIEQTKLLVTLASAFLIAPPAFVTVLKEKHDAGIRASFTTWLLTIEVFFVLSILLGYAVLGCLAGSQDDDSFNVYRPATRFFSLAQFLSYVFGISAFVVLAVRLLPP